MRRWLGRFDARDAVGCAGVGSLVYGVGLWSVPAAWVVFGGLALALWALPYLMRKG